MRVELSDIALELRRPVMTGRGAITRRDGTLIAITADGCTGWGEAMPMPGWPGADPSATRRALAEWAADPDPGNLPRDRFARGAVELALLDWEARLQGRTQAEVLADGGPVAGSVELNALVGDVTGAVAAVAEGYGTVKLKVGTADVEEDDVEGDDVEGNDVAAVLAVREAIGGAARLRLDANGAWTVNRAVAVLARLTACDIEIEYVEEPVVGLTALARVAERSPVPVAADDSLGSADARVPDSIPVVVVKPMALGGPRTAHTAARRWIEQGRKVVVTNYLDSAIGQHAALSVAAALPGFPQVHGAITPALFTHDTADPPTITNAHTPLPPHSPTPR